MDDVRRRLADERSQTQARLASLTGDHDAIVAASRDTIAFERSQIGALVRQVRGHLAEVDAALLRVSDGTYGVCERCGSPIGEARLEALPAARLCIRCASTVE